jgi:pimeloyl-ACP methyl ester carboxylesterase
MPDSSLFLAAVIRAKSNIERSLERSNRHGQWVHQDQKRHRDFLQGQGPKGRPAHRLSPRLASFAAPTFVMQGDDDSLLQTKPLKQSTPKIYPDFPHGMMTTHADVINVDLLAFVKA